MIRLYAVVILSLLLVLPSFADASLGSHTGFPIPRFVSLKKDKANARTGPSVRYPVKWVYIRKGLPVEITAEFEQWRKIRDIDDKEGWIHESLLSGKRHAIVASNEEILAYRLPTASAVPLFRLAPNAQIHILGCDETSWCEIAAEQHKGWVLQELLWGVYPNEIFSQ